MRTRKQHRVYMFGSAAALAAITGLSGAATAATNTWTAGDVANWATPADWSLGAYPGSTGHTTDDAVIDGETSTPSTVSTSTMSAPTINSLTITAGDTLNINSGSSTWRMAIAAATAGALNNAGTINLSAGTGLQLNLSGGSGATFVNTGTVTASGASTSFTGYSSSVNITNTGGTLSATTGAGINLISYSGSTITGGSLTTDSTSTFGALNTTFVQGSTTLSGVSVTNAGTTNYTQGTTGGSRTMSMTLTNGTFDNTSTGAVQFVQLGDHSGTTGVKRSLDFTIGGTNAFTNSNQVTIRNETNDPSSQTEYAKMTFGATNNFTNNGTVTIQNSATGSPAATYSQYAQLMVNQPAYFINNGTLNVIQDATVPVDAAHYATATFNNNWTNGGTVVINGTGASVTLSGKTYTQSAANTETRLLNAGLLSATAVNISAGTLDGTGTVTAATSIASGATLAPGYKNPGILTVGDNLAMNSGSTFALDISGNSAPGSAAGDYSQLALTKASSFTLTNAANLSLAMSNSYSGTAGDVYYILTRADSGAFGSGDVFYQGGNPLSEGSLVSITGLASNLQAHITYLANWTGTQAGSSLTGGNDVAVSLTSIPEPASLALLALGGLCLLPRRKGSRQTL